MARRETAIVALAGGRTHQRTGDAQMAVDAAQFDFGPRNIGFRCFDEQQFVALGEAG